MALCPNCEGLTERRVFDAPEDYRAFVGELIALVKQEKLRVVHADCPLESMLTPPWPNHEDTFVHELQCAACFRIFQLYVNTWNGRNWWEPARWRA